MLSLVYGVKLCNKSITCNIFSNSTALYWLILEMSVISRLKNQIANAQKKKKPCVILLNILFEDTFLLTTYLGWHTSSLASILRYFYVLHRYCSCGSREREKELLHQGMGRKWKEQSREQVIFQFTIHANLLIYYFIWNAH